MNKLILCTFLIVFCACNEKTKEFRYELKVVNKSDSTKNFSIFTDFNNDYDFYDNSLRDSIIFNKSTLTKVDGEFMFGLINNKNKLNKILFFSSKSATFPHDEIVSNQIIMKKEFIQSTPEMKSLNIKCFSDYSDTTSEIRTRQISYLLTNSNGQDTVGYQENVFVKTDEKLITTVLLYTNPSFKEELKEVAKELKSK